MHIIRVCEVDNINVAVVALQSLSKFFQLGLIFSQGVTDKNDNSLSLGLVLSVFKGELSYLGSGTKVCHSIYKIWLTN